MSRRFGSAPLREYGDDELPRLAVVIPVHNEKDFIARKLANIAETDYPAGKLEVIVADGLSDDGTEKIVSEAAASMPFVRFVQTGVRGKIPQINKVLAEIGCDIVVNTDVDGVLERNTLRGIASALCRNADTAVAGAFVVPVDCSAEDADFWRLQNAIRILESGIGLSSTVVAACYGFRKSALGQFPVDVIADDVYLPFLVNLSGRRTVYLESAKACELRAAKNFGELLRHKARKGNADLREIFRFARRIPEMPTRWLMVYAAKALHMIAAPFVLAAFAAMAFARVMSGGYLFVLASLAPVVVSVAVINSQALTSGSDGRRGSAFAVAGGRVKMFFITNIILAGAVLCYPFVRQTSAYKKVGRG
jgi:cellulose synthase/poly-beta-1,6-N-acetylglucosamine synthase-like glycosyltransferase